MKKYKTRSLNEATYLVMKGYNFKVNSIHFHSGLFTFEITGRFEEHRKAFWANSKSEVNISHWLMVRNELKNIVKQEIMGKQADKVEKPKDKSPNEFPMSGQRYWYKDSIGIVRVIVFGYGIPEHVERKNAGKCYQTREEASTS